MAAISHRGINFIVFISGYICNNVNEVYVYLLWNVVKKRIFVFTIVNMLFKMCEI